ncbi:MAG: hypothetical protein WDA16_01445 [Candidatus Thermoplasmatota archaeon]
MRPRLLSFIILVLVAAGTFGATAFNYTTVSGRTTTLTLVTDANAYVSLANQDTAYSCHVGTSNGKITITFAAACGSGTGTGVNSGTITYWENILVVTNKGDKAWTNFWANSSDTLMTINLTYSTDSSMTIGSTFGQNKEFASSVAVGSAIYLGIKADGTTKDTTSPAWAPTISFAARSSG